MTIQNLIKTTAILCTLCCAGAQQAAAQKMYKQGDAIVLDCGPSSGFPHGAVETQKGKKIAAGTPSDTEGPMTDNKETGTINKTVYQKLEVAKADAADKMSWANAYLYCQGQGEGWRLPTQRELMLISIFKDAIVGLGGADFNPVYAAAYWSSTEETSTVSWSVYIDWGSTGSTLNSAAPKTFVRYVRCVREL